MRLHRFYINNPIENRREVSVDEPRLLHQWSKVLRFKSGDKVLLFDGTGFEFEGEIMEMNKNSVTVKILNREERNRDLPEVTLYQSIIKKDKFEWVAEKATELGVAHIVPVIADRSEKTSVNMERLRRVVIEASEQSGRVDIPELSETRSLSDLILYRPSGHSDYGRESVLDIVLHTDEGLPSINTLNFSLSTFNLYVGPEGGWSEAEIEMFKEDKRIELCNIGTQILRAETAAVAVLSKVLLL